MATKLLNSIGFTYSAGGVEGLSEPWEPGTVREVSDEAAAFLARAQPGHFSPADGSRSSAVSAPPKDAAVDSPTERTPTEVPLTCGTCGKEYRTERGLAMHMRRHE